MKKILAAAAIVSLSLTGITWAQSSSDNSTSPGNGASGSQQGDTNTGTENPADTSAGDEPQCPPGQKSDDASATKADPKCVAE